MAKKGLIIGLSVASVVVIVVVVVMFFMGVFDDLFKKKSKPRVNDRRGKSNEKPPVDNGYCGELTVKEGPIGPTGEKIDKYVPYLKDNKIYKLHVKGGITDEDLPSGTKITVNGPVLTFNNDDLGASEIDIEKKTRFINGQTENYTDVYYNKSLNRIILLKDDYDGIDTAISIGIDGSYFNC